MNKDFLYCESTQTFIRNNDIVTIDTIPNVKWVANQGWFKYNGTQINGWYLKSITDGTIKDINSVDLATIHIADDDSTLGQYPADLDNLSENDVVSIDGYDGEWVVRYGAYLLNGVKLTGWYFLSLQDESVLSVDDIKASELGVSIIVSDSTNSEIVKGIPVQPTYEYIVVPGTNIRLYDNDIVRLTSNPNVKYIVHTGWYIYQGIQNFGWYACSLSNGSILPISAIDLTSVTLVGTYTQGSVLSDGKQVNYTRPFTEHDGVVLNRAFISVDTIDQRDNLSPAELVDGKLVRVNNVGDGGYAYFSWSAKDQKWSDITFETTLPVVSGSAQDEVILSHLNPGLYIVKGQYRVSTQDPTQHISMGDTLVSISTNGDLLYIKDINSSRISDYVVDSGDFITVNTEYVTKEYLSDIYATVSYVDAQIQALELNIHDYVNQTIQDVVPGMVDAILEASLHSITEEYVDNLFNANIEGD